MMSLPPGDEALSGFVGTVPGAHGAGSRRKTRPLSPPIST